jgi:4,5-dihydroxyphthalate decarboxylase
MTADVRLNLVLPPDPWVAAMTDGRVRIPGYTWDTDTSEQNAMLRFDLTEGADVGENGVRRLVVEHQKGTAPVAIPVWFGREHMQRNLLVRRDSDLRHPKDLVGKRVGSSLTVFSATGAGVLMMLEQAYQVPLAAVDWHFRDPESLPVNRMGLRLHPAPETREEHLDLLLRGELDAVIVTAGPRYRSMFGAGDQVDQLVARYPDLRPLIDDPAMIAQAYRATGLYLISDLVTVRPSATARDPELPARLLQALSEANALASHYRSADEESLARREIELLGEDPHVYGLNTKARHNLAVYLDFLYRLGAFERPPEPEELFLPIS